MPTRAARPCLKAGCRDLTVPGSPYCTSHQAEAMARHRAQDAERPSARRRGYDREWEKLRAAKLAANPLCEICLRAGLTEAADTVDHIRPHRGDRALLMAWENLQSLSKRCHDRKTATQDSSFARRRKRFGSAA